MKTITAKEIHSDLVLEADILLEEARNTVKRSYDTQKTGKADRLKALGFTSADGVDLGKNRDASELREQEEKYAMKYPGLKFVPTKAMEAVCEKYDLLIGGLSNYTGDVPDWALDLLEKNKHLFENEPNMPREQRQPMSDKDLIMMNMRSGSLLPPSFFFGGAGGELASPSWDNFQAGQAQFLWSSQPNRPWSARPKQGTLCIAAPRNEMSVGHSQMVKGREIVERPPVVDPIVSLRVDGGYIVLAAWGEEGSDPRILNQNNN